MYFLLSRSGKCKYYVAHCPSSGLVSVVVYELYDIMAVLLRWLASAPIFAMLRKGTGDHVDTPGARLEHVASFARAPPALIRRSCSGSEPSNENNNETLSWALL